MKKIILLLILTFEATTFASIVETLGEPSITCTQVAVTPAPCSNEHALTVFHIWIGADKNQFSLSHYSPRQCFMEAYTTLQEGEVGHLFKNKANSKEKVAELIIKNDNPPLFLQKPHFIQAEFPKGITGGAFEVSITKLFASANFGEPSIQNYKTTLNCIKNN